MLKPSPNTLCNHTKSNDIVIVQYKCLQLSLSLPAEAALRLVITLRLQYIKNIKQLNGSYIMM